MLIAHIWGVCLGDQRCDTLLSSSTDTARAVNAQCAHSLSSRAPVEAITQHAIVLRANKLSGDWLMTRHPTAWVEQVLALHAAQPWLFVQHRYLHHCSCNCRMVCVCFTHNMRVPRNSNQSSLNLEFISASSSSRSRVHEL